MGRGARAFARSGVIVVRRRERRRIRQEIADAYVVMRLAELVCEERVRPVPVAG